MPATPLGLAKLCANPGELAQRAQAMAYPHAALDIVEGMAPL